MSQDSCDLMFESRALEAFRTYLLGSGHPDDPDIRAMLGRDVFARDVGDRTLRPRLFIRCLCGTDSVPDEQNWPKRIQVRHSPAMVVHGPDLKIFSGLLPAQGSQTARACNRRLHDVAAPQSRECDLSLSPFYFLHTAHFHSSMSTPTLAPAQSLLTMPCATCSARATHTWDFKYGSTPRWSNRIHGTTAAIRTRVRVPVRACSCRSVWGESMNYECVWYMRAFVATYSSLSLPSGVLNP